MTTLLKKTLILIRWLLLPLYVPVSIVVSGLLALIIAQTFHNWEELTGAVILPIVGLGGAWLIAPRLRLLICFIFYFVGIFLTAMISPSEYPESYLIAEQFEWGSTNYQPFYTTVESGANCLLLLFLWTKYSAGKPEQKFENQPDDSIDA